MSAHLLESGFNGTIKFLGANNGILFPDGLLQTIAYQGGGGGGNVFDTLIVNQQEQFDTTIADNTPPMIITNGTGNDNFYSLVSNTVGVEASTSINTILLTTTQGVDSYGANFSGGFDENVGLGTFVIGAGTAPDTTALMVGNPNQITMEVPVLMNGNLTLDLNSTINVVNTAQATSVITIASQGATIDNGFYNQIQLTEVEAGETNGVILGGGTTPGDEPCGVVKVIGGGTTDPVFFFTQALNSSSVPFQTNGTFTANEAATFSSTAQFNGVVTTASTLTASLGLTTFASSGNLKFSYKSQATVATAALNSLPAGSTSPNISITFTDTFSTACYAVELNLFVTDGISYYPAVINYIAKTTTTYTFNITNVSGGAFPVAPAITYSLLAFGH